MLEKTGLKNTEFFKENYKLKLSSLVIQMPIYLGTIIDQEEINISLYKKACV